MTPDLLDDLLDRSAPATRAARADDLHAMVADAESQARPPRPRRRRARLAMGAGLAVLLVSGAGVAAATDGFGVWSITDPVGAVPFTMANGFTCELRFSEWRVGEFSSIFKGDAAFLADVNRTLADWYRTTDVVGEAQPLLPQMRVHIAELNAASADDPAADMSMLSPEERADEIVHRDFVDEWMAWEWVIADLESAALSDAGISRADDRFGGSERAGQIQCLDLDGRPYVPGAGK